MKLIIAEKPSLAKKIVSAIPESFQRAEGYYQSDNYIITYTFGHLFGLFDIEDYFERNKDEKPVWKLDILPYVPSKFQFSLKKDPKTKEVDKGVKNQFATIKKLINDSNVEYIVHCGDADREGEVIIRLILNFGLKEKKPVKRLWLPEQSEKTIWNNLQSMKSDADPEYESLYKEGLARTYIDWMLGINLTRYATIKANSLMNVGRVLTPIVEAIYQRNKEIEEFIPEKYWKIESKEETGGNIIHLVSSFAFPQKEEAEQASRDLNQQEAIVKSVEKKRAKKTIGKLFSLSKLQGVSGKKLKMSPDETLEMAQRLYEKGLITYPRTNTEYLAENEKEGVGQIIDSLSTEFDICLKESKKIFDDSKIESHSALTPTMKRVQEFDSPEEEQIYNLILNRFLAVFCKEDCLINKTTIVIGIGEYEFKLSGSILVQKGFIKYETVKMEDRELPNLKEGDLINISFHPVEKETQPPKKYSVETLNNYLCNPFKKQGKTYTDEELYQDMFKGIEIGTEPTRAGIIKTAIQRGFINLDNNIYSIQEKGKYNIQLLKELGIDMSAEKTVEMQMLLKQVYRQEISVDEAILKAKDWLQDSFSKKDIQVEKWTGDFEIVGKCPVCSEDIVKRKSKNGYFYGCNGYKSGCQFSIYGTLFNGALSSKNASTLLLKRKVKMSNLKTKEGKQYTGIISLSIKDGKAEYSISFPKGKKRKKK